MTREQEAETMARQLGLDEHRPLPPRPTDPTWYRVDVEDLIRRSVERKLV